MESESSYEVRFKANPTQYRFITARNQADLFSCRMGEGKSTALAWACFYHTRHNPGARWMFVRDTWENLRDTTQKTFFDWFPPGVMGEYKASSKTYTWKCDGMSGEVMFAGMDDPKDAAKLQSRELAGCAMDEPAPAADSGGIDEFIFSTVLTRMRQPGMDWYPVKPAQNNPDETHWTYRRFVEPGQEGFSCFQTDEPENLTNLPTDYYERLANAYQGRSDLYKRFVKGEYGFTQTGNAVTPQWADRIHLAPVLKPIDGYPLTLCWDWGLNPTCIITQITPLGTWNVLEAHVGEGIGAYQLITEVIKPRLTSHYAGIEIQHTGDPMGNQREQSDSEQSALRLMQKELGGRWKPGPVRVESRLEPLRGILSRQRDGVGLVQVDKRYAKPIWHALRGGWAYPVSRAGVTGDRPLKNIHSHPGDALSYGAAFLFPLGERRRKGKSGNREIAHSAYGKVDRHFGKPGVVVPAEAKEL